MTIELDVDAIAAEIHEFYSEKSALEGWPNCFPVPYKDLPEFMKSDNRSAARRIGDVLALAGLHLVQRNGELWSEHEQEVISTMISANIEILAEGEHDGWVETRLRNGWRLGPQPSGPSSCDYVERRQHHQLVPYDELSEKGKNKDRSSVKNYVAIISRTSYRISKERSAPHSSPEK